jgi:ribonuclease HI
MSEKTFYAVHAGHVPGVYQTWKDCEKQVKEYKRPLFRKFNNYEQATHFFKTGKVLAPISMPVSVSNNASAATAEAQEGASIGSRGKSATSSAVQGGVSLQPRSGEIVVYTDGASSYNGKPNARAGYGIYFPLVPDLNTSAKLPEGPNGELPSNQRAELMAILKAIELVDYHYQEDVGLLIVTDSKYSMQCVYPSENKYGSVSQAWAVKWKKNGWINSSGQPVKNRDIIEPLFRLVQNRNLDPDRGNVRFIHVRGHQGIAGNEAADKLAVLGKNLDI